MSSISTDHTEAKSDSNNIIPDAAASFKGFSTFHSWYKHIIGDNKFGMIPVYGWPYQYYNNSSSDLYWYIDHIEVIEKYIVDEDFLKIIKENTINVTPFVYTENHGFCHTIGQWGFELFDWMETHGYKEEAKIMKPLTVDNSTEKDSRYKVYYKGDNDHNVCTATGPVNDIYVKEHRRILNEIKTSGMKIWTELKQLGWNIGAVDKEKSLKITMQQHLNNGQLKKEKSRKPITNTHTQDKAETWLRKVNNN